jgi:predicted PurR-regulated permease PerM
MLRSAGVYALALAPQPQKSSDDRPSCLENPRPEGAESTLTENAGSPFPAEPAHITVVLAGFLAILFDPVVVILEKLHLPRGVAAAGIVLAGMGLIGLLGHELYGRAMTFAEELPVYTSKIQQTIEPISRKIQKVQQSAGNLTNDVHATKKVPEVRLQESPSWPAYLVRGVGSVWGALIIAGVVPFLTFFMLCTKDQMVIRMNALFSSTIDTARFITNLNQMIRGFVVGNLIIGSVMAVATTLMLWGIGMKGAIPLGIASGLLNLLPFLGLIFSLALPLAAVIRLLRCAEIFPTQRKRSL